MISLSLKVMYLGSEGSCVDHVVQISCPSPPSLPRSCTSSSSPRDATARPCTCPYHQARTVDALRLSLPYFSALVSCFHHISHHFLKLGRFKIQVETDGGVQT